MNEYDPGPLVPGNDGAWVLNARSTLPLSVLGVSETVAKQLQELLKLNAGREVVAFVVDSNVRCREVEEYIRAFRPAYLTKIEELKTSSAEWSASSAHDREDLLVDFRRTAVSSLRVRPYCDLVSLFESEPNLALDDLLVERFGYENLRFIFPTRVPARLRWCRRATEIAPSSKS